MHTSDVTLPEEEGWDHILSLEGLVDDTRYAILDASTHLGKRVLLVKGDFFEVANKKAQKYTALEWASADGVHYDGDGSMHDEYLKDLMEKGKAEITTDWKKCEDFLRSENGVV
jgi:hypothetical protein